MPPVDGSPTAGAARAVRVTVFGTASMTLATAAHLVGGGQVPSPAVLGVLTFLVGLAALVLTSRRCRFPVVLGVLAGEQALLHIVFDTASRVGPTCGAAMAAMPHATHALPSAGCAASSSMAPMGGPGTSMWTAHVVATALTALLLARGEAWLWRLGDAVVRVAAARPTAGPWSGPGRPALAAHVVHRRTQPMLSRAAPRGPPCHIAVA